jgi:myo-inositol catabolism protein IolC
MNNLAFDKVHLDEKLLDSRNQMSKMAADNKLQMSKMAADSQRKDKEIIALRALFKVRALGVRSLTET